MGRSPGSRLPGLRRRRGVAAAGGRERAARSYLVEGREVQPEAQLGHGQGATAAEGARDGGGRLPQDRGSAGPPSARPHLHVGLVTAGAYFP